MSYLTQEQINNWQNNLQEENATLKESNKVLVETIKHVVTNSYYGHDEANLDVRDRDKLEEVLRANEQEVKDESQSW